MEDWINKKNSQSVSNCFEDFHCNLYSSKNTASQDVIKEFLKGCERYDLRELNHGVTLEFDAEITLEEVKAATAQFHNSKASGPDGFGEELYKAYISLLAVLFLRIFIHSGEEGSLTNFIRVILSYWGKRSCLIYYVALFETWKIQ